MKHRFLAMIAMTVMVTAPAFATERTVPALVNQDSEVVSAQATVARNHQSALYPSPFTPTAGCAPNSCRSSRIERKRAHRYC